MPVQILDHATVTAAAYGVIGTYRSPKSGHVRHVALLSPPRTDGAGRSQPSNFDLTSGCLNPLDHVVIPDHSKLQAALTLNDDTSAPAHLLGHATNGAADALPFDLQNEVEAFIEEVGPDRFRYFAHPPFGTYTDDRTSRTIPFYTCVGFVLKCYERFGTPLLDSAFDDYPDIEARTLFQIYPELNRKKHKFAELGLVPAEGPWPLVLPAYVFHALDGTNRPFKPDDASRCAYP